MATYVETSNPVFQAFDNNGDPAVGYLLYTYEANSTTPLATYTDSTGGTSNANPVELDARGEASVFRILGRLYKFVLKTSAGVTVWTMDNIGSSGVNSSDFQVQTYTAFTTGGTSTAYTLTPSPAITANTENQRFQVEFHTASGASPTMAVSGLTALNLKYRDASGTKQAVTTNTIPSGWRSDVVHDGTDWVLLQVPVGTASDTASGIIEIAIQSEMETATDTTRAVVPGRQHYHPGHPKAWGLVTVSGGTYTLATDYGVASINKNATGQIDVTLDTAMSSSNYCVVLSSLGAAGRFVTYTITSTTVFRVFNWTIIPSADDNNGFSFAVFGDQ